MKTSEIISAAINIAALVFVGAQVLFARRAIKQAAQAQQQEWGRLRKQATIEAAVSTSRYRESLKAALPWNDRDPDVVAAFLREANGDYAKLMPVREYLNHLMELAVGVRQGVFDLETLSLLTGGRIIDTVRSYGPHIENVRRELGRPGIYSDLDDLVERLTAEFARTNTHPPAAPAPVPPSPPTSSTPPQATTVP